MTRGIGAIKGPPLPPGGIVARPAAATARYVLFDMNVYFTQYGQGHARSRNRDLLELGAKKEMIALMRAKGFEPITSTFRLDWTDGFLGQASMAGERPCAHAE